MKRIIILFFISLLIPITSTSQIISKDSVLISTQQLKQINLIFAEHEALKQKVPLLNSEITLLNEKVENLNKEKEDLIKQDSIKTVEFNKKEKRLKNTTKAVGGLGLIATILAAILI